MTNRTVLIVDDSKIAGVALGRVLEQHGLTVELAESGQDCLDYLRRNIPPGAIFLDHMMPGMDGFDVLRAVKANAQTTAIPIIMYTSRDGQAYMGEAMTLGAYDVLSKPIKVIDLLRILRRLGLLEDTSAPRPAPTALADPVNPATERTASTPVSVANASTRESDLTTLLAQQRAELRRDLAEGLETLTERLGRRGAVQRPSGHRLFGELNRWHVVLYGALLLVPILWSVGLYQATQTPRPSVPTLAKTPAPVAVAPRATELRGDMLLEMAAWAANLSGQYEYSRAPLDDTRLQILREMLMRLSTANFHGTVRIDTHVGEFCLVRGANGEWLVPDDDTAKDKCEFLNLGAEQYVALGRRQSASFAGFLQNSSLTTGDAVNVQVVSHGRSRPFLEYPIFSNIQTAGEWNRVARLNNRVEFTFVPRETVAAAR